MRSVSDASLQRACRLDLLQMMGYALAARAFLARRALF